MKKGQKYLNRTTRRTVTIKDTYSEGERTVINFTHGRNKVEVGAMYADVFNQTYKKK